MLKRIPKSDISIRPFKTYKEWYFDQDSTELSILEANATSSLSSSYFPKNSIYGQLRAQFYNGHEDNPFLRFGAKNNVYNQETGSKDRFLENSAKVISIPQIYVGEGIKKGSLTLIDSASVYVDDTYGNLKAEKGATIYADKTDVFTSTFLFHDINNVPYTASLYGSVGNFDMSLSTLKIIFNGTEYTLDVLKYDVLTGEIITNNDLYFLVGGAGVIKIGNVFYNQGLITITRTQNDRLLGEWDLSYKSTKTIYEHEYLLVVEQDEFNVSQNPSAIIEKEKETQLITDSDNKVIKTVINPGVKYIKKKATLDTGEILDYRIGSRYNAGVSGGFGEAEYSSSMDTTGSYLVPFITTIGLYDDSCDLVAVAKLPQPIKSEHDIPVNFIVRFDT